MAVSKSRAGAGRAAAPQVAGSCVLCGFPDCPASGSCKPTSQEVCFSVVAETLFGSEVRAVGALPALGAWQPEEGVNLTTTPETYPLWSATALVPATLPTDAIEFKYVILMPDGSVLWEDGPNRTIQPSPVFASGWTEKGWTQRIEQKLLASSSASLTASDWEPEEEEEGEEDEEDEDCAKPGVQPYLDESTMSLIAPEWKEDEDGASPITMASCSSIAFASDWEEEEEEEAEAADAVTSECEPEEERPDSTNSQPLHPEWKLHAGAHQLHKPGGPCEDAFFCSPRALGVADGVGQMAGFSQYGVDSAAYAMGLMERTYAALQPGSPAEEIGSVQAKAQAAVGAAEREVAAYGASTICVLCLESSPADIANLDDSGFMRLRHTAGIANLGDSGFMLLRGSGASGEMEVVSKSEEQQHGWNFPYQLMRIPQILRAKVPKNHAFDTAADCGLYTIDLLPGDLLLLYTDGLSDNLHQHEILEVVRQCTSGPEHGPVGSSANAEALSRALAVKAQERSRDEGADVPFNEGARRYGHEFTGGKADDITVVAAWVGCDWAA